MKNLLTNSIYLCFFLSSVSYGQNPDIKRTFHWYFGNGVGLDFTGQNVILDTSSNIYAVEGCATISDTCGNLLFYSNGDTIWNSNHNIVLNGTGLMGCYSSTQSVLFVPQPGNDSLIYVFTTDCGEFSGSNGFRYSILNINANFNEGEIILKNILLFSPTTEKLCATKHANGIDYWIAGHEFNSANYYIYLLNNSGLSVPIIQTSSTRGFMYGDGYMIFNPNGSKIASAFHLSNVYDIDSIDICEFDNSNGTIFNCMSIQLDTSDEVYGACFSPNGNNLFYSTYNSNSDQLSQIWQLDLTDFNYDSVFNSKIELFSSMNNWFYAMQLGATGEIYISHEGIINSDSLCTIINPDINPSFLLNSLDISPGKLLIGLPNYVSNYLFPDFYFECTVGEFLQLTPQMNISIFPNPCTDYINIQLTERHKNERIIVDFFDYSGKLIASKSSSLIAGKSQLNINEIENGAYILHIFNSNFSTVAQIIKMK